MRHVYVSAAETCLLYLQINAVGTILNQQLNQDAQVQQGILGDQQKQDSQIQNSLGQDQQNQDQAIQQALLNKNKSPVSQSPVSSTSPSSSSSSSSGQNVQNNVVPPQGRHLLANKRRELLSFLPNLDDQVRPPPG